jgi:MarR family
MAELADSLTLSRGGLTKLADRLEAAGLLRREPVADDGRGLNAVLTEAGEEMLRRMWPVYSRVLHETFVEAITADEAGGDRSGPRPRQGRGDREPPDSVGASCGPSSPARSPAWRRTVLLHSRAEASASRLIAASRWSHCAATRAIPCVAASSRSGRAA